MATLSATKVSVFFTGSTPSSSLYAHAAFPFEIPSVYCALTESIPILSLLKDCKDLRTFNFSSLTDSLFIETGGSIVIRQRI